MILDPDAGFLEKGYAQRCCVTAGTVTLQCLSHRQNLCPVNKKASSRNHGADLPGQPDCLQSTRTQINRSLGISYFTALCKKLWSQEKKSKITPQYPKYKHRPLLKCHMDSTSGNRSSKGKASVKHCALHTPHWREMGGEHHLPPSHTLRCRALISLPPWAKHPKLFHVAATEAARDTCTPPAG